MMTDMSETCNHCRQELRHAMTSCSEVSSGCHHGSDVMNIINSDPFGEAPLIVAVKRGLNRSAHELLRTGSAVNRTNEDGRTALHYAAKNGNIDAIELLIEYQVDKNCQDDYGFTPLMLACRQGHHQATRALVEAGCDVNIANEIGETALFYAAKDRTFRSTDRCAQIVINGGANVDHQNHSGCTPLHMAVQFGKVNIVKMLLNKSCCKNIRGRLSFMKNYYSIEKQINPLEVAYLTGNFEICSLLIAAGSETNILISYLKDSLSKQENIPSWLIEAITTPSDLRSICRSQIRAYCEGHVNDVIDKLPLPVQIKEFLSLPEIDIV